MSHHSILNSEKETLPSVTKNDDVSVESNHSCLYLECDKSKDAQIQSTCSADNPTLTPSSCSSCSSQHVSRIKVHSHLPHSFAQLKARCKQGPPYICLNMIVKNESHIIRRCMTNVAPLIDYFAIVDTGSTDDTISIIMSEMQKRGIPGEVAEMPWNKPRFHFGPNRTKALRFAEQSLFYYIKQDNSVSTACIKEKDGASTNVDGHQGEKQEKQDASSLICTREMDFNECIDYENAAEWNLLESWYLLFTDADNLLLSLDANVMKPNEEYAKTWPINRALLKADMINCRAICGDCEYAFPSFATLKRRWVWKGNLHEYITLDEKNNDKNMTTAVLVDGIVYGGHEGARNKNPNKYRDDALVLEEELSNDPNNSRAWYYCANSWFGCGEYEKAEYCFMKRVSMSDETFQETYISYIRAAQTRWLRNMFDDQSVGYLLRAIDVCPERLEAPCYLVTFFNQKNMFRIAYHIGMPYITDAFWIEGKTRLDQLIQTKSQSTDKSSDSLTKTQSKTQPQNKKQKKKQKKGTTSKTVDTSTHTPLLPVHWFRYHSIIQLNSPRYLLLNKNVYQWEFLDALTCCAYNCGRKDQCYLLMKELLPQCEKYKEWIPEEAYNRIKANAQKVIAHFE